MNILIDKLLAKQLTNAGLSSLMALLAGLGIVYLVQQWQPVIAADDILLQKTAEFALQGRIISMPKRDTDRLQFVVEIETLQPLQLSNSLQLSDTVTAAVASTEQAIDANWSKAIGKRVRLNWYHPPETLSAGLIAGQKWYFTVKFKPPRGLVNPGSMDYEAVLFARKIELFGNVQAQPIAELRSSPRWSWAAWRDALSLTLFQRLESEHAQALLPALLVGNRQYMQAAHWQILSATGTQHLMAISGLHIGLFAMLGYGMGMFLVKCNLRLLRLWPAQLWASVFAVIFATLYAAMAGFAVPTQRALLMLAVLVILKLVKRSWSGAQLLWVVAGLVVTWDPRVLLDKGFWLSFIAVGCLFWGARHLPRPQGWRLVIRAQWLLFWGLLPINWFWFDQIPGLAPVVNLIAIPWVGWLLVPGVLLWAALEALGVPNAGLLTILTWLVEALWWGLSQSFALSERLQVSWQAVYELPKLTSLGVCSLLLGLVCLVLPRPWPARYLGIFFLLPVLMPPKLTQPSALQAGEFEWSLLDVGQGLASVVRTQQHLLVYDAGNAYPGFDLGSQVVAPFIEHLPNKRVDMLVLSHMDQDHADGAGGLLAAVPVEQVMLLPNTLQDAKQSALQAIFKQQDLQPAQACVAGHEWQWDGVLFRVLFPLSAAQAPERNLSCVLQVVGAEHRLLLAGDIDRAMETSLRNAYPADSLSADVMLVPHHGSKTSSSTGFIHQVKPEHAVISSGWGNPFGHPHPEVVRRYQARDITVWNTAEAGMLRFLFTNSGDIEIWNNRRIQWPWRFNAFPAEF